MEYPKGQPGKRVGVLFYESLIKNKQILIRLQILSCVFIIFESIMEESTLKRQSRYEWSYLELKNYIQEIYPEIQSRSDWEKYFFKNDLKPAFIPSNPVNVYKGRGWKSWGDFLGTKRIQSNIVAIHTYFTCERSREVLKEYEVRSREVYRNLKLANVLPKELPTRPNRFYKSRGWVSWKHYLNK